MKPRNCLIARGLGVFLLLSLCILSQVIPSHAAVQLFARNGSPFDYFGTSVSISGDTIIVGAPFGDSEMPDSGWASVFRHDGVTWREETRLSAQDGAPYDYFGYSTSISGNVVVVGALANNMFRGSAYVFRYVGTGWEEEAKLVAADGADYDCFGYSVSISGDMIVVGAPFNNSGSGASGSIYVFSYDGSKWIQSAKVTAADGAESDAFGVSVSLNGNTMVVGAPNTDGRHLDSGSAYVFEFAGSRWTQAAKLTADDAAESDYFGSSVSTSENRVVVGAPYSDEKEPDSGSAYVFEREGTGWNEKVKLVVSNSPPYVNFGTTVSTCGSTIVVGTPFLGLAYVYWPDGTLRAELTSPDSTSSDGFGNAVAATGNTVVVGAPFMDWGAPDFGTAYVFTFEESSSRVYVDIHPGACPNPVNTRSKGVLPVALLGTVTFDVNRIDPGTIRVSREGVDDEVAPARSGFEDVATPFEDNLCGCHKLKGDGNMDLSLKFSIQELVTALRLKEVAGATITLTVTGNLKEEFGGTPFQGQDCIRVSK